MKTRFFISACLSVLLSACSSMMSSYCTNNNAYQVGFNDAKHDRDMRMDSFNSCAENSRDGIIENYKKGYESAYSKRIQINPAIKKF